MSGKPYKIPPGWSERAAELIWYDWTSTLEGRGGALDRAGGHDIWDEMVEFGYYTWHRHTIRWTSPEHRLRAWAAVGAPIRVTPEVCGICATCPPLVYADHSTNSGVPCGGSGMVPDDT